MVNKIKNSYSKNGSFISEIQNLKRIFIIE